ncbi:hypothetical protein BYT27DRAFT_7101295 [Phlegmacium glaucopus]|nr:hypothetical protein BYT27DRAFT_7101295 [Phlegmacium glaucopus]
MNGEHTNAVAGPSTYNSIHPLSPSTLPHSSPSTAPHSSVPPLLFLPPLGPPPPKQHLASTQDLLSRFHLLPAYNKYVRPSLLPGTDPSNEGAPPSTPDASITPGTLDKGKGKEVVHGNVATMGNTPVDMDLGDGGDGDDDDAAGGKGEKKKKNTYKHLIKGVPGKHSLKKDDSLTKVMLVPPKQRMRIAHFDSRTQEDAFTVSLEGLKGWNINTLVLESAQAREDRKKRKELKRLAKLQAQQGGPLPQVSTPSQQPPIPSGTTSTASPVVQSQPIQAPIPTSAASGRPSTSVPQRGATPKSGGASVGTPRPASTAAPNGASAGTARPGSTVPRPGSTVPRPSSTLPNKPTMHPGQGQVPVKVEAPTTIMRAGTPMNVDQVQQRGMKREREDGGVVGMNGVGGVNGVAPHSGIHPTGLSAPPAPALTTNGHVNGNGIGPPRMAANAKAGTAGVRPRPIKKQRMDVQGQARDVAAPVQQPTPQGV